MTGSAASMKFASDRPSTFAAADGINYIGAGYRIQPLAEVSQKSMKYHTLPRSPVVAALKVACLSILFFGIAPSPRAAPARLGRNIIIFRHELKKAEAAAGARCTFGVHGVIYSAIFAALRAPMCARASHRAKNTSSS